jgi:hypothetical protein
MVSRLWRFEDFNSCFEVANQGIARSDGTHCRSERNVWFVNLRFISVGRIFFSLARGFCLFFSSDLAYELWASILGGMARPQFADGGDAPQIRRVAANILNNQSRTADKGWSSSLGVGRGANNSSPKKIWLLRKTTRSLAPGRIPWINKHSSDICERR